MFHSKDLEPNLIATELQRKIGLKYLPTPVPPMIPKEGRCARIWRTKIKPNWVLIVLAIGLLIFLAYRFYTTWVWKQEQAELCNPVVDPHPTDQIDDLYAREIFLQYRKNDE